jgi:hypothetical protein
VLCEANRSIGGHRPQSTSYQLSSVDRLVEGKDGAWTKTEWASAVSFDEKLNRDLLTAVEVGQSVTLDGRIEPRRRQVGDATITDHSFVLTKFERLSKPAKAAAKAA